MQTLLVNFDKIDDPRVTDKLKDTKFKCIVGDDFKYIQKNKHNYEKIIILFDDENLDFANLLEVVNTDDHKDEKFYVIVDSSNMNEDREEYVDDVFDVITDFVDGVVVGDRNDLNDFIVNYLK